MCLVLTQTSSKLKAKYRKMTKPIVAYKVLRSNLRSVVIGRCWRKGINISSRESTRLTSCEVRNQGIDEGFHLFLDLREAVLYTKMCFNSVIYRCHISPKDVVAVGD